MVEFSHICIVSPDIPCLCRPGTDDLVTAVERGETRGFEARLETVLADPRLPAAITDYAQRFTALYGEPKAVSIMGDLGRFAVVAALFSLPSPVIQAAFIRHIGPDLAGRARIASHLAALRECGAVEPLTGGRRAQPIVPTAWLEGWMVGWLAAMVLPARPWWDSPAPAPDISRALLATYLGQILAANRSGLTAFATVPGVRRMMSLVGGHLFMLELILASANLESIGAPVAFSRRAFAARFGVSRGHAVDLAAEAEGLDWMIRQGDGHIVLTSAFARDVRRWSAIHFVLATDTQTGSLLAVMGELPDANI